LNRDAAEYRIARQSLIERDNPGWNDPYPENRR